MQPLFSYFDAEKQGAMLLLVIGIASVALATAVLAWRGAYAGAGVPFVALGVLAVGIGSGVWARTDHQVALLGAQMREAPAEALRTELPRMQRVRRTFLMAQIFEIALLVAGVAVAYLYRDRQFGFAFGVGLIAQAAFLLVFDLIADRRAAHYLTYLKQLV
jgi:hypothetical protein